MERRKEEVKDTRNIRRMCWCKYLYVGERRKWLCVGVSACMHSVHVYMYIHRNEKWERKTEGVGGGGGGGGGG